MTATNWQLITRVYVGLFSLEYQVTDCERKLQECDHHIDNTSVSQTTSTLMTCNEDHPYLIFITVTS